MQGVKKGRPANNGPFGNEPVLPDPPVEPSGPRGRTKTTAPIRAGTRRNYSQFELGATLEERDLEDQQVGDCIEVGGATGGETARKRKAPVRKRAPAKKAAPKKATGTRVSARSRAESPILVPSSPWSELESDPELDWYTRRAKRKADAIAAGEVTAEEAESMDWTSPDDPYPGAK